MRTPSTRAAGDGTAVLLHGSGSTADFARRALGPALSAAGWRSLALEDRTGDADTLARALATALDDVDARAPDRPLLVAGISLGAHAAVRWAAGDPRAGRLAGLVLALPAWTGAPAEVASLSAAAADEVERDGLAAVLERLRRQEPVGPSRWVGEELCRAWPAYGAEGLVAALRATAASPGPSPAELAAVPAPVGLLAVREDPFHPVEVARQWARLLPRAAVQVLPPGAPAVDRGVLGRAGLRALAQAGAGGSAGASGSR